MAKEPSQDQLITKQIEQLLQRAVVITTEPAEPANIGFAARALVLCTMPHKKPTGNEFRRQNGNYRLTMYSPNGLPYGIVPRLLLAWIVTEAVRKKTRILTLGHSISDFMKELGMARQGGVRGDITRLREQMGRLFGCSIHCSRNDEDMNNAGGGGFMLADGYDLWWHPQNPDQASLWGSKLTLSEKFFQEITTSPVPLDMRALKALKRSPMALDLYMWLTFRYSYLKVTTVISWAQLQLQFGADYRRTTDFKIAFKAALRKVLAVYPAARVSDVRDGLMLTASPTHVPKRKNWLKKTDFTR